MAKKAAKNTESVETPEVSGEMVDLSKIMSTKAALQPFRMWLIGTTPLITHAWSEKARKEMLNKQKKETKVGKEKREPELDFVNSLYVMNPNDKRKNYGFPVTGIKNAILSSAHKDKGVARSTVQSALWLDADMVSVKPAYDGAICDLPLVRIFGSEPQMREDMVRIGSAMTKTANLAYRSQFTTWGIRITGKFNPTVLPIEALLFLVIEAGAAIGIGEWRNEKKGMFGAFRPADLAEQEAWEKFAAGKGPLPVVSEYQEAAE